MQKNVLGKVENPAFSKAEEITTMPIQSDRFFHKLQCEQMGKFVGVGLDMKGSIDSMSSKIDSAGSKIDGMSREIGNMNSKLDTLPGNMAREIAKLKKNGFL